MRPCWPPGTDRGHFGGEANRLKAITIGWRSVLVG